MMFEEKFSEYESDSEKREQKHSLCQWDDLTSRTLTMPTLPASAVWGIYGPLWALIHPSTHTQMKVNSDECVCSLGRSCTQAIQSSNSHRKTPKSNRIHLQMTPQWFELETVWERHEEPLRQHSLHTLTDLWYSIFISQCICIYPVIAYWRI